MKKAFLTLFFISLIFKPCQAQNSKILIIHITGVATTQTIHGIAAEEFDKAERVDQHIEDFLIKQFGNSHIFQVVKIPFASGDALDGSDIKMLDDAFFKNDKIVVEIAIRYNGNIFQWAKEGTYPDHTLGLFENASHYVVWAVKHFKSVYPNSQVAAFSMYAGANVLIKAIESGINDFDQVRLVAPTIYNEEAFDNLLSSHGYNDKRVTVITAEGDEYAPVELQGGKNFTLIKLMKESVQ